jgi:hypothetical protein
MLCVARAARVTLLQEREIRIVGELKQSKEQYKRDTTKLSSERDALEDAGALWTACGLAGML